MLEKFHCVQSVICVCLAFLSPDQECLRSIVQQSIKTVSTMHSVQMSSEFNLSISGNHIKEKIASLCPSIWQCHFSSISGLETTLHLSVDPPVDYIDVTGTTIFHDLQNSLLCLEAFLPHLELFLGQKVPDDTEEDSDDLASVRYHMLKATAIARGTKF